MLCTYTFEPNENYNHPRQCKCCTTHSKAESNEPTRSILVVSCLWVLIYESQKVFSGLTLDNIHNTTIFLGNLVVFRTNWICLKCSKMFNSKASVNIVSLILSAIRKTFICLKYPLKTILQSNDSNCKLISSSLYFLFIVYILSCEKFVRVEILFSQKPSIFPVPDMAPMNSTCQLPTREITTTVVF